MNWQVKLKSTLKKAGLSLAATLAMMSAQAGTVTVSNYPLALLSHAVTQGKDDAQVLLSAGDVGHHGSLSPSKMQLIGESDFVVWFGENLEQNLVKSLKGAPNSIALLDFNTFHRLPLRNLDGTPKDGQDVHLWLDPVNARAIVRALAVIHSAANPQNKEFYQKNADEFVQRMSAAAAEFADVPVQPYWAYHDSFAYLERAAGLQFAGALTPDHHLSPKASQLRVLGEHRPKALMCLMSQAAVSNGITAKLGGVQVSVQQEDMSGGSEDFVQAWQALATDARRCVG